MSPRSEELAAEARSRLRAARRTLDLEEAAVAASVAYYACLYAARAALSERDLYAKTHSGAWHLFTREFVEAGPFAQDLAARARAGQRTRELGDYEARPPSLDRAAEMVVIAEEFVAAVMEMLGE